MTGLADALRAQAAVLLTLADAADGAPTIVAPTPRYADLHEHGAGTYRKALLAINAGELPAFEAARGKRLVRVEDWHAWLERDEHRVKPESEEIDAAPEQPADELGELIEINARRRRKAGR